MGIITSEIFSILVFMAIFTTLTVPLFLTWTTTWLRNRNELVHQESRSGYIILGANPLGLYMAKQLQQKDDDVIIIDANREMVAEAKKQGFNSMYGNILKEETLEDAKAIEKGTFIGLTGNSEINFLAAQLADDAFYIPNKIVLVSPSESGTDVDMLDKINATSLFANKTELKPWAAKISNGNFEEKTYTVEEEISTREWVKQHKDDKNSILPFFIVNTEGIKRPFHYNDTIDEGEKIIYLE
jgi:Trk K+ transport system NAD-binding subunit